MRTLFLASTNFPEVLPFPTTPACREPFKNFKFYDITLLFNSKKQLVGFRSSHTDYESHTGHGLFVCNDVSRISLKEYETLENHARYKYLFYKVDCDQFSMYTFHVMQDNTISAYTYPYERVSIVEMKTKEALKTLQKTLASDIEIDRIILTDTQVNHKLNLKLLKPSESLMKTYNGLKQAEVYFSNLAVVSACKRDLVKQA